MITQLKTCLGSPLPQSRRIPIDWRLLGTLLHMDYLICSLENPSRIHTTVISHLRATGESQRLKSWFTQHSPHPGLRSTGPSWSSRQNLLGLSFPVSSLSSPHPLSLNATASWMGEQCKPPGLAQEAHAAWNPCPTLGGLMTAFS